jgi:glycosyltransferase involved in cell wall biosynthesis
MDEKPKYKFKGDYYTLNIDDIYTNGVKRLTDLIRYAPGIKRICDDLEIDTVIAVSEVGNFYAVLSRWLFNNKVRIIATQHMNPEIFLDDKLKFNSIKFFYPRADEVICVSRESEKILNEVYHIYNTRTIYNMMDIQKIVGLSQEELPVQYKELYREKYFKFINIGRLVRQKGQWFMIRSFRGVVDKYPHARLYILGDGPIKEDLEDLISKLELDEHVFILGEQENVFPFLGNSDCFVFTSLWEGLPLVLIEALSMSIPVISSDCKTGPKEILCPELDLEEEPNYPYFGTYAILNQPFPKEYVFHTIKESPLNRSEENLVNLMIKMIKDPDLKKKYSKGQVRAEEFDKHHIMSQWNKLLKDYQ